MIFVSVGTTHFPFNRLVDSIKQIQHAGEKLVIQYGHTTQFVDAFKGDKRYLLISFCDDAQLERYLSTSRISIIQAGEGSWIRALESCPNSPIVVPRDPTFGEHVDSQQIMLAQEIKDKALVVMNPEKIVDLVENYNLVKVRWKKHEKIVNVALIQLLADLTENI